MLDSLPAGAIAELILPGMHGRFINIVVPGRETDLSICEVEVYGSVVDVDRPEVIPYELVNKPLM